VLSCVNGHYSSLCIMERTSGQKRESVHFLWMHYIVGYY
jgi:hypothetical protein